MSRYVRQHVRVHKPEGEFTLGELRQFVRAADFIEMPDDTPIRARSGWRRNRDGAVLRHITTPTRSS